MLVTDNPRRRAACPEPELATSRGWPGFRCRRLPSALKASPIHRRFTVRCPDPAVPRAGSGHPEYGRSQRCRSNACDSLGMVRAFNSASCTRVAAPKTRERGVRTVARPGHMSRGGPKTVSSTASFASTSRASSKRRRPRAMACPSSSSASSASFSPAAFLRAASRASAATSADMRSWSRSRAKAAGSAPRAAAGAWPTWPRT